MAKYQEIMPFRLCASEGKRGKILLKQPKGGSLEG